MRGLSAPVCPALICGAFAAPVSASDASGPAGRCTPTRTTPGSRLRLGSAQKLVPIKAQWRGPLPVGTCIPRMGLEHRWPALCGHSRDSAVRFTRAYLRRHLLSAGHQIPSKFAAT